MLKDGHDFVGSWVKLDESYKNGNERPFSIHNGNMENLLAEAAEDRISATHSHRQRYLVFKMSIFVKHIYHLTTFLKDLNILVV